MGKVIEIADNEEFDEIILNNKIVVVDFGATWCGPCQTMKPVFESFADTYEDYVFCSVDVDECPDIQDKCEITKLPTFLIYKNKENCDEHVGGDVGGLEQMLKNNNP
jgi:thioredoxin 1